MEKPDCLDIDRIAFIGRTYREYMSMFDLDESVFKNGPVLDCPAGPSSFKAEARGPGFEVVACDLFYGIPAAELLAKGKEDIAHVFEKVDGVPHLYVWKNYNSRNEIIDLRQRALRLFVDDYASERKNQYVHVKLPRLPFPDRSFPLVLSSHFLFLYGNRLDLDFHKACLKEMSRVSSQEVRIYPLQGLDARPYPHLDEVTSFLEAENISVEIEEVPFEFQRGSNKIMKLKRTT